MQIRMFFYERNYDMTASTEHNTPLFPLFLRYVSANVLGMIGYSCYILADTFFIARGIGADALAALNLVLPAYSLMNGTGLMIGMGAAARYTISSAQPGRELHRGTRSPPRSPAANCTGPFSPRHCTLRRWPP